MSDYAPKPNSVAARAIAYLETLPAGTELMTSTLAEAINVPGGNMAPNLEAPLTHGLLHRRQRDTHVRSPWWWSLTDYSSVKKAPWPPALATMAEASVPAPAPKTTQTVAAPPIAPPPPEKPRKPPASPAREANQGPLRIALWSDGVLDIQSAGGSIRLGVEDTRALVGYLERMAVAA